MSDLISRLSELRSQYSCFDENERGAYHTLSEAIEALKERKTGKWEEIDIKDYKAKCSSCGTWSPIMGKYCSHCGARMVGEEE